MKKVLQLILLIALSSSVLLAQSSSSGGNTLSIQASGAPAGVCGNNVVYTDSATGNFYNCKAGTWNLVSGGGGGGTPASPDTSVQFNTGGSFGGDSNFLWDNTNKWLGIGAGATRPFSLPSTADSGISLLGTSTVPAILETHNSFAVGLNLYTHNNGVTYRSPVINLLTSYGTQAAPAAMEYTAFENNPMGQINFWGYDGGSYAYGPGVIAFPSEAWTPSAHGSWLEFNTIGNGGTVPHLAFQMGGETYTAGACCFNVSYLPLSFAGGGTSVPTLFAVTTGGPLKLAGANGTTAVDLQVLGKVSSGTTGINGELDLQGSTSGTCSLIGDATGTTTNSSCKFSPVTNNTAFGDDTHRWSASFTNVNISGTATLSEVNNGDTGHFFIYGKAPTISSGFGASPSIAAQNGQIVFEVNVGTGGATSGVLAMNRTATTGWGCSVNNLTAAAGHRADNTRQTAFTATTITVENQTTSTGAAVAWTDNDILIINCMAF